MHTSGLQGEVPWQDLDRFWVYRPEELPGILHLGAVRTPSEKDVKYSNFAFEILGLLVERVAGRPFEEHVRAAVLDPLGMADTTWHPDPDQAARKATGYDARLQDDTPAIARDLDSGLFLADGGLWSTAEDLGRWLAQQLRSDDDLVRGEGQVLPGRTLTEMHRPVFLVQAGLDRGAGALLVRDSLGGDGADRPRRFALGIPDQRLVLDAGQGRRRGPAQRDRQRGEALAAAPGAPAARACRGG